MVDGVVDQKKKKKKSMDKIFLLFIFSEYITFVLA